MSLPYTLRLLCLLTVIFGAVYFVLHVVFAAAGRAILRKLSLFSARQQERALYGLQMAPLVAAVLFAGALCFPEYLRNEANHAAEHVSIGSILIAAAALVWFGVSLVRGFRVALRTARFARACRRIGTPEPTPGGGLPHLPVLAIPEPDSLVALAGLLRPVILVSRELIQSRGLDGESLAVALEHERSHAHHCDNWKLLSLHLLPSLPAHLTADQSWLQLWQQAAEWAADDDAVRGDPERSFVLAETLVRVARAASPLHAPMACTALSAGEPGLAARIERLLAEPSDRARPPRSLAALACGLALAAGLAAAAFSPWIYAISEHLLHLG